MSEKVEIETDLLRFAIALLLDCDEVAGEEGLFLRRKFAEVILQREVITIDWSELQQPPEGFEAALREELNQYEKEKER